jgi:hypothetical protein
MEVVTHPGHRCFDTRGGPSTEALGPRSPEDPMARLQVSTSGLSTVRYNSDFASMPMPGSSGSVT